MASVIAAIAFMGFAALRAQRAYLHRDDAPLVAQPYVNSAIRLGAAGIACFAAAKVLS